MKLKHQILKADLTCSELTSLATLRVAEHGAEGADDVIGLQLDDLVLVFDPFPVLRLLRAAELQPRHLAVLHGDLAWRQEGQELTLLLLGQLHLGGERRGLAV